MQCAVRMKAVLVAENTSKRAANDGFFDQLVQLRHQGHQIVAEVAGSTLKLFQLVEDLLVKFGWI